MMKCYLMCGIPGSGKSTWAKNNCKGLPIVSRDIIRHQLGYTKDVDDKAVCTPAQEKRITDKEYSLIDKYAKSKTDFVLDDTNTNKFYRKQLIDKLNSYDYYIIGVNINTPIDVCIERRKNHIPENVMRMLHKKCNYLTEDDVDELINIT